MRRVEYVHLPAGAARNRAYNGQTAMRKAYFWLAAALALPAAGQEISFAPPGSDLAAFATTRLREAARGGAVPVAVVAGSPGARVQAGGFEIRRSGGRITVTAPDETGALYGALDVAEQIRMGGAAGVREKVANPRFPFRAVKFNLPWSSYRRGEALQLHTDTVRDLQFWARFLDMMAENRFNALTLWALHPWPYMIRARNFPRACPFGDAELAGWQAFWHKLFAMAKARGVEVYLVNWNIFVSEAYRDAYDPAAVVDGPVYNGPSYSTAEIRRYNRESVTQVLDEYPDLAGIGITLGERMADMTIEQQVEWVEDVYFRGVREARRPAKFIYRAALKNNDPAFVRRSIERSGLAAPVWVELKFNWSHAYSTATLVHAHGGGTGEPYWNPPPVNHKMAWMMRNEDFFLLRWGQPEFIREHIARNGGEWTGGYFVGSECYIPAKEYGHRTDSPHLTWQYAFEKQWLYYQQWGRLLYDPETPDTVFEAEFDRRYGAGVGKPMVRAYALASRMPLRLGSLFFSTWDYTLYAEGFLAGGGKAEESPFISIDRLIAQKTLDPDYVSIRDYVRAGEQRWYPGLVTPPALADALERDAREALRILPGARGRGDATLACERDDVQTWAWLSLYLADKLRAAVVLETARVRGDAAARVRAVALAERAAGHWEEVARITGAHLRAVPLMHLERSAGPQTFTWGQYLADVRRDIEIARGK